MQDLELQILQDKYHTYFTPIKLGSKSPYLKAWQQSPKLLSEIPDGDNIGLLLGDNILAIDFDGEEAFQFWLDTFDCEIPIESISWTSNKTPYNMQILVLIPPELQPFIRTLKVSPNKKLEFRYLGTQSVMPPSIHPTTNQPYIWLNAPYNNTIQMMPPEVLIWLISACKASTTPYNAPQNQTQSSNQSTHSKIKLVTALNKIKAHNPTLLYDEWWKISYSAMTGLGITDAVAILNTLWPELPGGSMPYNKLAQSHNKHPISAGYIINKAKGIK